MPCANPLQKFSLAKLALLVGVTVQASARSPAVRMFKLRDGGCCDWAGAAARIGAAQARVKPKTRINRIKHLTGPRRPVVGVLGVPRNHGASGKYGGRSETLSARICRGRTGDQRWMRVVTAATLTGNASESASTRPPGQSRGHRGGVAGRHGRRHIRPSPQRRLTHRGKPVLTPPRPFEPTIDIPQQNRAGVRRHHAQIAAIGPPRQRCASMNRMTSLWFAGFSSTSIPNRAVRAMMAGADAPVISTRVRSPLARR